MFLFTDGDLPAKATAKNCLMKQKHRMIWERRHGPVGTGMRVEEPPMTDRPIENPHTRTVFGLQDKHINFYKPEEGIRIREEPYKGGSSE